jgi:hypothetical protein
MPIEIRELQITTIVQDAQSSSPKTSTSSSSLNNDAVIAACVNQVLEILQQKIER